MRKNNFFIIITCLSLLLLIGSITYAATRPSVNITKPISSNNYYMQGEENKIKATIYNYPTSVKLKWMGYSQYDAKINKLSSNSYEIKWTPDENNFVAAFFDRIRKVYTDRPFSI